MDAMAATEAMTEHPEHELRRRAAALVALEDRWGEWYTFWWQHGQLHAQHRIDGTRCHAVTPAAMTDKLSQDYASRHWVEGLA